MRRGAPLTVLLLLLAVSLRDAEGEATGYYGTGSAQCSRNVVALALNFGYTGSFTNTQPSFEATICSLVRQGLRNQAQWRWCRLPRNYTPPTQSGQTYNLLTVHVKLAVDDYTTTSNAMPNFFDRNKFYTVASTYGVTVPINSVKFVDINECSGNTHGCSPNAVCENTWGFHKCKCKDGYKDTSENGQCPGSVCKKTNLSFGKFGTWMYVLIGVAVVVLLMVIFCCCCFYSGSANCREKPQKRIHIVQQPLPVAAQALPPPCICKPPEEKKIIIQLESAPPALPPALPPVPAGHSAFIANSDAYEGNVYVSSGATRALPWSGGSNLVSTVTPVEPQITYVQEQPQMVQMEPQMMQMQPQMVQMQVPQVQYAQEQQPMYVVQDPTYMVQ